MMFKPQINSNSALLAFIFSFFFFFSNSQLALVMGWNATIYESANCTGGRYEIYPTAEHTKYFELAGSYGAEMACAYFPAANDTTLTNSRNFGGGNAQGEKMGKKGKAQGQACKEQFPVAKSVFSRRGACKNYSGGHSSGEHMARQGEGECKTTGFDIKSVVCFDEHEHTDV